MTAYYSSLAMVTSAVLYLVAMTIHAVEWASVRGTRTPLAPALVHAGAGVAEGPPRTARPAPPTSRTEELLGRVGLAITVVAAITHVLGVVLRGVAADRAPWGNMYEFITTSLAIAVLTYLVLAWRSGMRWLGLPVTLLLTVGQGLAVTVFYVEVSELMPALHSVWFIIHIIAAATSGAAFNIGGIAAILYLIRARGEQLGGSSGYLSRLPAAEVRDRIGRAEDEIDAVLVDLHGQQPELEGLELDGQRRRAHQRAGDRQLERRGGVGDGRRVVEHGPSRARRPGDPRAPSRGLGARWGRGIGVTDDG